MCDKRGFPSKHAARESVQSMGNTIRVYPCGDCHGFHVTKDREGNPARNARAWQQKRVRGLKRRGKMND